ncbi:MAG: phosphopentomutase [Oscillospiraceae bacterium]|nr:phosphopentomutase [Oscillospiraceae bacterium]
MQDNNIKRSFLIVLDSCGIGDAPDADKYGDFGSNTLKTLSKSADFYTPNLKKLGLFNIDGIDFLESEPEPIGRYARVQEASAGKDTITGHWEIAGIISEKPLPTYPNGFPEDIIKQFEKKTGRKVLCNLPYSGTEVIKDFGKEHVATGSLIVYTSADSVFQIAAHEGVVSIDELYKYCKIARDILVGDNAVGRVIARPFEGEYPRFVRTLNRHDFSLSPTHDTILDEIKSRGEAVVAVGKINDIFSGKGITESIHTSSNNEGMNVTMDKLLDQNFKKGICFTNLVDFDMKYGHRRNIDGYAKALSEFDEWLGGFIENMGDNDRVIITADHGCDPAFKGTDHTRECVPMIVYDKVYKSENFGTFPSFVNIGDFAK